eukprot:gene35442-42960_t
MLSDAHPAGKWAGNKSYASVTMQGIAHSGTSAPDSTLLVKRAPEISESPQKRMKTDNPMPKPTSPDIMTAPESTYKTDEKFEEEKKEFDADPALQLHSCPKCVVLEARIVVLENDVKELRKELRETKDELRLMKEELRLMKEELRLMKEELRLMKEELRVTSDKLNTVSNELTSMKTSALLRQIALDVEFELKKAIINFDRKLKAVYFDAEMGRWDIHKLKQISLIELWKTVSDRVQKSVLNMMDNAFDRQTMKKVQWDDLCLLKECYNTVAHPRFQPNGNSVDNAFRLSLLDACPDSIIPNRDIVKKLVCKLLK